MVLGAPGGIIGIDGSIVLMAVALVLLGSTQILGSARSLGGARRGFEQGIVGGGPGATDRDQMPRPVAVSASAADVTVRRGWGAWCS
jgi:hypothetical protein